MSELTKYNYSSSGGDTYEVESPAGEAYMVEDVDPIIAALQQRNAELEANRKGLEQDVTCLKAENKFRSDLIAELEAKILNLKQQKGSIAGKLKLCQIKAKGR